MNPYLPLAVLVALIVTGGASYLYGGHVREAELKADAADAAEIRKQTIDASREGAAQAISEIEVKNVTIRQQVETEIREKPVYRDCINTADGLQYINQALTGTAQPVDNGQLPATTATD